VHERGTDLRMQFACMRALLMMNEQRALLNQLDGLFDRLVALIIQLVLWLIIYCLVGQMNIAHSRIGTTYHLSHD
jgi:hypothetical protein